MNTAYPISEQDELHYVTFQMVRWIDIFIREWILNLFEFSAKQCRFAGSFRSNPCTFIHRTFSKDENFAMIRF